MTLREVENCIMVAEHTINSVSVYNKEPARRSLKLLREIKRLKKKCGEE